MTRDEIKEATIKYLATEYIDVEEDFETLFEGFPNLPCCLNFSIAMHPRSDTEGWKALITRGYDNEDKDDFNIWCVDDPIKFCPWCGKEIGDRK